MKKFLVLIVMCLVALSLFGCSVSGSGNGGGDGGNDGNGGNGGNGGGGNSETTLTVVLGQTAAYFTDDDVALYPIQGESPYEGEYIEKTIKVEFSGVTRIALAFESASAVPSGLKFTVNNGEVKDFALGEFYTAEVEEGETECKVKVKVWLAGDASEDLAGTAFEFSIKAMGV